MSRDLGGGGRGDLAVPQGDPASIRAAAQRFRRVSGRALATAAIGGAAGPELALYWEGAVAGQAQVELGQVSARGLRLLPGIDRAGAALGVYADVLERTIGRARALRARAEDARVEHARSLAVVRSSGADPVVAALLVERADRVLEEALGVVHRAHGRAMDELMDAGAGCARMLGSVSADAGGGRGSAAVREEVLAALPLARSEIQSAAVAPVGRVVGREPETWWDAVADGAGQAAAWTYNHSAVPLVNGTANVLEAMAEHPEDVVEMALGAGQIIVGLGGNVGGVALDSTGVGVVAGVPLHIAASGLMVSGAATTAHGAGRLASHAAEKDNRLLNEVSGLSVGRWHGSPQLPMGPKGSPLPDEMRPEIAGSTWKGRVARNGNGEVWQAPDKIKQEAGQAENKDTVRIEYPDSKYEHGAVRFYNSDGQPLRLDGRTGSNAETHIEMRPDGSFDIPKGWSPE